MKQKFFTLLLGLAMVSLGAVAQDVETIVVGSSAAKTYVSQHDLDFSTMTNYTNGTEVKITPYYISYYSNGSFTLTRYPNGLVPAGYPMILFSKQGGGSFDVPHAAPGVVTTSVLNNCKKFVYTNSDGAYYLVPVVKGESFSGKVTPVTDSDADQYSFTFWSIPDSGDDFFTEGGVEKYRLDGQVSLDAQTTSDKTPMTIYEVDQERDDLCQALGGMKKSTGVEVTYGACDGYIMELTVNDGATDLLDVVNENEGIIIYTPATDNGKTGPGKKTYGAIYWHVTKLYYDVDDYYYWSISSDSRLTYGVTNNDNGTLIPWDSDLNAWYTETTTSYKNNYNQYILGLSNGNPVFKKCPNVSGDNRAKVAVGGCFARVYVNTTSDPAASREEIGFVFDDDEMALQDSEVTGIRNFKKEVTNGTVIYNINGQKLAKLQKGVNIVNGKKVYVK